MLRSGKYNFAVQDSQPDGSVKITLGNNKTGEVYRLHISNLGESNEKLISQEVLSVE